MEIHNEDNLEELDTIAAEYDVLLRDALIRLQSNEDFILVFENKFIDAWSITNTRNMSRNDNQTRLRVFEKMNARGEFCKFCDDLIDIGNAAEEALNLNKE